jgi:UDP-glucose 4-epimerase
MNRILITGGSGFIGSYLIQHLRELGYKTLNIDIADTERSIDIRHLNQISSVFESFKPEVVFHLAALASVPLCEDNKFLAFNTNVLGTFNVIKCVLRHKSRLIFTSSAAVYGNPIKLPSSENSCILPINCYGRTKLCGEQIAQTFLPNTSTIFRIFNCYGPYFKRSYVVSDVIKKLRSNKKKIKMLGTGDESRDFIYIDDVISAFCLALESKISGVYNLGTGISKKISDVVKIIARVMRKNNVEFVFEGKMRKGDFLSSQADVNKIKNKLSGWEPKISFVKGVEKCLVN